MFAVTDWARWSEPTLCSLDHSVYAITLPVWYFHLPAGLNHVLYRRTRLTRVAGAGERLRFPEQLRQLVYANMGQSRTMNNGRT